MSGREAVKIGGHAAQGFEAVREAFERNFDEDLELGAAFSVYRDGERLVDLHAGFADRERRRPWRPDTLATVWSTTKGVAAPCCARRADPGRVGRALVRPALASLGIVVGLYLAGIHRWVALVGLGACAFAFIVTVIEYARGVRANTARGRSLPAALANLGSRNRRRYGGDRVCVGGDVRPTRLRLPVGEPRRETSQINLA